MTNKNIEDVVAEKVDEFWSKFSMYDLGYKSEGDQVEDWLRTTLTQRVKEVEAEAYQAGIDEAVRRVKALKRPRFIKMNGGREMYDKFSFFYNQALDDFIKALQDNK